MLFHRILGTSIWHCNVDCSVLRVSRPFLLQDRRESEPAADELCEECKALLLEGAVDRLLELESRMVEMKAKLKRAGGRPISKEVARQHLDVLKTSLLAVDEYRALLFRFRQTGG